MPETKDLEELGQNTVAEAIAKAENTSVKSAKEKLKRAEDRHFEIIERRH